MGRWRYFTHHERVDDEVVVFEGIESRRSVDAIFVVLAEFEEGDDGGEAAEDEEVEDLH